MKSLKKQKYGYQIQTSSNKAVLGTARCKSGIAIFAQLLLQSF